MYSKIIINTLLIIALVVIQLSFVSGLPTLFSKINLSIIALIFILGVGNFKLALWWAIGVGLILSIYSFIPFNVYLVCFLATLFFINFLLTNFITNRSLYSYLTLTIFAYIFFKILMYSLSYLAFFISREEINLNFEIGFWANEFSGLAINLLAVLIIFYLLNYISKNLKPVFLIKRR